jgi:GalNAc-alpha-(1->4)-GalNAc-alpha-(1->3)-diNAcBac-PP-undecaprenol alpha-1,4-N-acetyl-D-galactosaminyltransferase
MAKVEMYVDRIILVISDLQSGGTQRVVSSLANYWVRVGKKVTVITFSTPEDDFFRLSNPVERISIGGQKDSSSFLSGLVSNLRRIRRLRDTLETLKADLAIGLIGHTNILLTLAGMGLKTKIIISERNDPRRQSIGRLWDFLRQKIYPYADLVTSNSREVVTALEDFVPGRKLAYLPNPVSIPDSERPHPPRQNKIVAVGRLHHQKAHDILIPAFAKLSGKHPDWRLEIVGEGGERPALQHQIDSLGMAKKITLAGRVQNVEERLAKSKIFAMPSRYEGTPNALLEALSLGIPAVISDASAGALEYVRNGESGLIVPVNDIDGLEEALCKLVEDDNLRQAFADRSTAMVEHLSLPKVAEVWESILDQVG